MIKKLLLSLSVLFMSACTQVPAGHVGVKVYLLGSNKGVDHEVLGIGRYYIGMNEQLFLFPVFQQNYTWTHSEHEGKPVDESMNVQTKENMNVNMDVGISYHLQQDKVPEIFQKYRKPIEEIQEVQLRNSVRNALTASAAHMSVDQILGADKEQLLTEATKTVQAEFNPEGIMVDKLYLVSSPRPPQNIIDAINSKLEAVQKAQQRENEVAEATAQAQKEVAKAKGDADAALMRARAEAEANQLKLKTLTKELIQYEAIQRWNGQLPHITGGAVPFINVDQKQD